MVKNHLKRMAMPRTWQIPRKEQTFIMRPYAGRKQEECMSLNTVMIHLIKCAKTNKEVKSIIHDKQTLIDGKQQVDDKRPVGLMDVVTLKKSKEHFRVLFNKKGILQALPITETEASVKPCKIIGKTVLPQGKLQLNCGDGKNILITKKDTYKLGDTIILSIPDQKVQDSFTLEKGSTVYFTGGKMMGKQGVIHDIKGDVIEFVQGKDKAVHETRKEYAFVLGKDKPCITLEA
jgi:small subunit ribosomal protein S4e